MALFVRGGAGARTYFVDRMLDAVRIDPNDDLTTVTATQIREVVDRLRRAGQHRPDDPDILIVFDADYDVTRLAHLLTDLPVELVGRIRSDRVLAFPASARPAAKTGRPAKHGPEFALADTAIHPEPAATTCTDTDRYGLVEASAWNRLHPRLKHRDNWPAHSPTTYAALGRSQPPVPTASPRHESAAGFGTSARQQPCPPAHRNPPDQALDDHQAPKTSAPPHSNRSARTPQPPPTQLAEVKRKAQIATEFGVTRPTIYRHLAQTATAANTSASHTAP